MKRMVGAAVLTAVMMLLLAMPAAASVQPWWCEDDPILHFSDGTSIHLVTTFQTTEQNPLVTYEVQVPTGVTVRVTKPAVGHVAPQVNVTGGGNAGVASITVSVSGSAINVTQTGGGAGKQTHSGSGGTATFSVTLGH